MITELRERGVSNVTQLCNQTETQLCENKDYIHKATHVTPALQSTTFCMHDSIHNSSWQSKLESHCHQQCTKLPPNILPLLLVYTASISSDSSSNSHKHLHFLATALAHLTLPSCHNRLSLLAMPLLKKILYPAKVSQLIQPILHHLAMWTNYRSSSTCATQLECSEEAANIWEWNSTECSQPRITNHQTWCSSTLVRLCLCFLT